MLCLLTRLKVLKVAKGVSLSRKDEWWLSIDDKSQLIMKVDWWLKSIDDESQLMMKVDWWLKLIDDEVLRMDRRTNGQHYL